MDVFSNLKHPAILIEASSITHSNSARLIAKQKYQAAIATGIADGVQKYLQAVSKAKAVPSPIALDPPVRWMEWPKGIE